MAIKPDFHILARDCGNGKLDWKNHIHTSEKAANDFRDRLDGKWKIFKLEPVEVIEEINEDDGEYYVEQIPEDEMFHGSNGW